MPALSQFDDVGEDLGHQQRRQPHRRFVEQQQARLPHQRAADGEHLLLAARQSAGRLRACRAASETGRTRFTARVAARKGAEPQIVLDRERPEHLAAFGHLHDAQPHAPAGAR